MKRKIVQMASCDKCKHVYALTKKCPFCLKKKGRTIKVMSFSGGAVHDWGTAWAPTQCNTPIKSIVFLPEEAVVTCKFCNPWPSPPLKWLTMTAEEKKKVRNLPSPDEVAKALLPVTA